MNNIQTRTTVNKTATERKIDKENTNSHADTQTLTQRNKETEKQTFMDGSKKKNVFKMGRRQYT